MGFSVGDRVYAKWINDEGTVLAVHGNKAWVLFDGDVAYINPATVSFSDLEIVE
jgi:hypothetical protein